MSFQDDSQPSQDSVMTVTNEDPHEILYFAYGSNLWSDQMLHRCPSSTPVGLGQLTGWRWIINSRGYANVVQTDNDSDIVQGLLYLLPPSDEKALDGYEGVPTAYGKEHLSLVLLSDAGGERLPAPRDVQALVYIDRERTEAGLPWEEYVERLHKGIGEAVDSWGMDKAFAAELEKWLTKHR